jgi:hypothetical protein
MHTTELCSLFGYLWLSTPNFIHFSVFVDMYIMFYSILDIVVVMHITFYSLSDIQLIGRTMKWSTKTTNKQANKKRKEKKTTLTKW